MLMIKWYGNFRGSTSQSPDETLTELFVDPELVQNQVDVLRQHKVVWICGINLHFLDIALHSCIFVDLYTDCGQQLRGFRLESS